MPSAVPDCNAWACAETAAIARKADAHRVCFTSSLQQFPEILAAALGIRGKPDLTDFVCPVLFAEWHDDIHGKAELGDDHVVVVGFAGLTGPEQVEQPCCRLRRIAPMDRRW